MDEKELRTGNAVYVIDNSDITKKIPGTIISCPRREVEYCHSGLRQVSLEAIPITDKILLNNGFSKNPDTPNRYYPPRGGTFFVKNDIENNCYYIGMEDSGKDRHISININYIHQLQNALYYIRGMEIPFSNI